MKSNYSNWLERLVSREERLMQIIVYHLSQQLGFSSEPNEEDISLLLVDRINKDPNYVKLFFPAQDEATAKKLINGKLQRVGRIDIKIILERNPETYLAIEAKKLNKRGNSDVQSYIADGLLRFVTEKYSADMPIGCMLGYVIGVDINKKHNEIQQIIESVAELRKLKKRAKVSKETKKVVETVNLSPSEISCLNSKVENERGIGKAKRFKSEHNRMTRGKILITHTLLEIS